MWTVKLPLTSLRGSPRPHELGHALDGQDQVALTYGRAFGTRDVPEDYVGAEARLDEAFARAVEPGPPPSALVEALAETCGEWYGTRMDASSLSLYHLKL